MRTPPLGCAVLLALVITPAVLVLLAQTPPPAPSPSRKESSPASGDYGLRWGVKIPNSILWQKNYNSAGVVADETAKDARTAHVQVYHDTAHASTIQLPLR
jgi:hypothetical protein